MNISTFTKGGKSSKCFIRGQTGPAGRLTVVPGQTPRSVNGSLSLSLLSKVLDFGFIVLVA